MADTLDPGNAEKVESVDTRDGETGASAFERLMSAALLGAGTAVWEWNILGDELAGNDGSVSLLGYPRSERVNTQEEWNRLIHPDERDANEAAYQRHVRGESEVYEHEYRALAHDGHWRWLSERGRVVEWTADGRPARMVGTLTDITQRRRAEGQLLEMAERLHKIARHVPGIVFQFLRTPDGHGRFPYVSDSCGDLTGLSPDDLMQDARAMLRMADPEDLPRLTESIETSMRTLKPWSCDFRLHRADGRVRWLNGTATPQREAGGAVLWHGYMQDVTERRELEQERQARAMAEAASSAKTRFLSRMSHELRTPLNAVLGFAQLMELDTAEPLTATQKRRVTLIREAGSHLLDMIGELLDLTRIESGKLVVHLDALLPGPLLAECLEMLRPQADAAGVTLALEAAAASPSVRADALRLRQVVLNLLSNAIKYNHRGGSVQVLVQARGTDIALKVRDTGVGIAAEDLESLFEPFHRGAHQRSAIEGAGIGLAITRGLVALMHGRLEVCSTPREGSTFSVWLPRA